MPLSRSPRMDRRRRAIREGLAATAELSDEGRVSPTRTVRHVVDLEDQPKKERGAAYSHSVRRACQHRLVQFIPVRRLSLTGAIAASVAIPLVLMTLHYCIFVNGALAWSRHPMSTLLNANNPRSLAAWLSSHLWLLCLTATIFTFRLRKHKLDDYEGEYRLWFWLVFTCVIGSIDSTTRLTELFGAALDRWSQLHVGWTGGAIVQATLATLVGLLGLRLCSELKTVPASLVLWLAGLGCWATSAALGQSLLRIDISPPMREWLKASLWLGGLTSIWLAGLLYLRSIFMEAQQRFLARSVMSSASAVPWRERLTQAMPRMPKFGRRSEEDVEVDEKQPSARKRKKMTAAIVGSSAAPGAGTGPSVIAGAGAAAASANIHAAKTGNSRTEASDDISTPKRRWGLGLTLRPPKTSLAGEPSTSTSQRTDRAERTNRVERDEQEEEAAAQRSPRNVGGAVRSTAAQDAEIEQDYGKRGSWFRRRSSTAAQDDGEQSGKSRVAEKAAAKSAAAKAAAQAKADRRASKHSDRDSASDGEAANKRSLRERLTWKRKPKAEEGDAPRKAKVVKTKIDDDGQASAPKRRWLTVSKPKMPKVALPKPRIPKLKLPSFRLPPPQTTAGDDGEQDHSRLPNMSNSRQIPSTSGQVPFRPNVHQQDGDADNARGLSKAERKRLRRLQRDDDEGERRAA